MEFGATYPYEYDSLHKIAVSKLREYKGSFGEQLNYHYRKDILDLVPSHARSTQKTFPGWKQSFIRQNREFYSKNRKWLDKWIPKIRQFPSSLQKLEWNCKGEERNIWNKVIQIRASGVRVKRPTTSPSIVAMTSTQVPIIGWEKRYMTVRELARLQSLDSLKKLPKGGLAIEAFGNAVNSSVVKLILKNLIDTKKEFVAAA
jgi:DNA (cytosine-5)-methyltransferase 1